jgi:hypothetical protein
MATAAELRKEIKLIEKALAVKSLSVNMKTKFRAKLRSAKQELKKGGGKKTATKGGVSTSKKLQDLLKTIKSVGSSKRLAVYENSGIDIPKDAGRPALPKGRRISKNGKPYTENRANRYDVKQPPKTYPKLENGGYMAKGGMTPKENLEKELRRLQRDLNSSRLMVYREGDTSDEQMARNKERSVKLKRFNEVLELLRESENTDGGMMSDGGSMVSGQDNFKRFYLNDEGEFAAKIDGKDYVIKYRDDVTQLYDLYENGKLKQSNTSIRKVMYFADGGYMDGGGKLKFTTMTEESFLEKYGTATNGGLTHWLGNRYPQSVKNTFDILTYGSPIKERREGFLSAMKMNGYKVKSDGEFAVAVRKRNIREDGGYMEGGGWLIEDENEKRRIVNGNEKPKVGSKRVDSDGKSVIVKNVLKMVGKKEDGGYMAGGGDIHRTEMVA